MAVELPSLGAHRIIAPLPDFDADERFWACELLCQEGFTTWSLPIERLSEVAELLALFGRRARIGISGVTGIAQVRKVAQSGAVFAASAFLLPKLAKAVPDFPVILGGLTPTELQSGLDAGAAAVQVVPAETYGAAYARVLPRLLGYPQLLATGHFEPRAAEVWLESGVIGVWPNELISPDLLVGPSLDALRGRLQEWRFGS